MVNIKLVNKLYILLAALLCVGCVDDTIEPQDAESIFLKAHRNAQKDYKDNLMRTYGVGYGYEATERYADYNSVRDRVIDIQKLRKYETDNNISIFTDNYDPALSMKVLEGIDSEELSKSFAASAGVKIEFPIFNAEVTGSYASSELKRKEYSFCTIMDKCTQVSRHCDPFFIRGIAKTNPEVLSEGFRSAIARVRNASKGREMVIDSLLRYYGSFFIYEAELGGKITYTSTYEKKMLTSDETLSFSAKADFCKILGVSISEESKVQFSQTHVCHRYALTAEGGDVSICSAILRNAGQSDKPGESSLPKETIDKWFQSITFDPNSKTASNVELIDFKLCPIYELIPDDEVRAAVAARFNVFLENCSEDLPRVHHKSYAMVDYTDIDGIYDYTFYQIRDSLGALIMEGGAEFVNYQGSTYRLSCIYPVIDNHPKSEGIAVCIRKDDAALDSLFLIQWIPTADYTKATLQLTPISTQTDFKYIYYNDGALSLRPHSKNIWYTPLNKLDEDIENEEDKHINLVPSLFCWNEDIECTDICRVGPWLVAIGPVVSNEKDKPNYYVRVCNDAPQGWEYLSATNELFKATVDGTSPYLRSFEEYIGNPYSEDYFGLMEPHEDTQLNYTSYTPSGVLLPGEKHSSNGCFVISQGKTDFETAFKKGLRPLIYRKLDFEYR